MESYTDNHIITPEKKENKALLNPDVEAVNWLKAHKEILTDKNSPLRQFIDIDAIFDSLEYLDQDLNINPDRKSSLLSEFLKQHCRMNNVDPNSASVILLRNLIEPILLITGEEDPRNHWHQELAEQSSEEPLRRFANLTSNGGFWGVSFEADQASTSNGAKEIQTCLAQALIELAHNQSRFATKPLAYFGEAPDPSTREKCAVDANSFETKAQNGTLPWQTGDNPEFAHLRGLKSSHTTDALIYNPLIKIIEGRTEYRDFDSLESLPIRVFREDSTGKNAEYKDIPANIILTTSPETLQKILLNKTGDFDSEKWQQLSDLPNLNEAAPIFSISLGGSPRPNSALFRHSHSGQSVIDLHFNNERGRIDTSFSHVSFDGLPGIDWAFALAEVVGAKGKNSSEGLEIDWQPPTQFGTPIDLDGYRRLYEIAQDENNDHSYLDNAEIDNFLHNLNLSDISLSAELSPEKYAQIKKTVDLLKQKNYDPLSESLNKILANDTTISKEAKNNILHRLLGSKMTVSKFMDMMGRQFYGPEVGCMNPRIKDTRLSLIEVKEFSPELVELIRSFPSRKAANPHAKIFDSRGLGFFSFLTKPKIDANFLKDEIQESEICRNTEMALTWLHSFSALTVLQRETDRTRVLSEETALVLNSPVTENAQVVYMTSHGGDGIKRSPDKKSVLAILTSFKSAQTTDTESRFSIASSDIKKTRNSEETIRYNDRIRVTSRTIDRLRISNAKAMEPAIKAVANALSFGDETETERIISLTMRALNGCVDARKANGNAKDSDFVVSSLRVITTLTALEYQNNPDNFPDLIKGLQYLVIAGLLDQQNSFMDLCTQAAQEIFEAISA